MRDRLDPRGNNVQSRESQDFINAISSIQCGEIHRLSTSQEKLMDRFLTPDRELVEEVDGDRVNFADLLANKGKRQCVRREYENLNHIPCTTNIVERLFSTAKWIYGDRRQGMSDKTFEAVLLLRTNWSYFCPTFCGATADEVIEDEVAFPILGSVEHEATYPEDDF